jgi:hypothetical protein
MGAGRPNPFALVVLAEETRKATARISERAAVEQILLDLMITVNTQLDPHEQLSFVAVVCPAGDAARSSCPQNG